MATGLRDHFNPAFYCRTQYPRPLVVAIGFALDCLLDPPNAFEHIVNAEQGRMCRHQKTRVASASIFFRINGCKPFRVVRSTSTPKPSCSIRFAATRSNALNLLWGS